MAVAAVAAHLVAIDDAAQVAGQGRRDLEDEMDVVRHHLLGEDAHLRIVAGDALHLGVDAAAQRR